VAITAAVTARPSRDFSPTQSHGGQGVAAAHKLAGLEFFAVSRSGMVSASTALNVNFAAVEA
jgi:hypothetical protein